MSSRSRFFHFHQSCFFLFPYRIFSPGLWYSAGILRQSFLKFRRRFSRGVYPFGRDPFRCGRLGCLWRNQDRGRSSCRFQENLFLSLIHISFLTRKGAEGLFPKELAEAILQGEYAAAGVTGYYLLNDNAERIMAVIEELFRRGTKILFDPSPLADAIRPDILRRMISRNLIHFHYL